MERLEKLFLNIKQGIEKRMSESDLIRQIRQNDEMVLASNSYCERCGNCCSKYCANKEQTDGISGCSLHSSEYPVDKQIPDYDYATREKLDSKTWVKPECCFTYGPYLTLLASLYKNTNIESHIQRCKGSSKIISEFIEWKKKL